MAASSVRGRTTSKAGRLMGIYQRPWSDPLFPSCQVQSPQVVFAPADVGDHRFQRSNWKSVAQAMISHDNSTTVWMGISVVASARSPEDEPVLVQGLQQPARRDT